MADIRPFRGVHYNSQLLRDWSRVVCPVYDIISAQQEEELYRRSEYNFVRLEAGRELPQDTPADNKYTRAASTLDNWLNERVLETDPIPAMYLHDHYFEFGGKSYKRRALIARVRLEEWDKMVVRPHESTLSGPKSDRLSLLWAIRCNTSSVLSLYEDESGEMGPMLQAQEQSQLLMDLKVADGEGHRVWAITDSGAIGKISAYMAGRPLYIADGHHRYESALNYRRQRRAGMIDSSDQPVDFVMMTLVEFSEPGLLILPTHRLVRGISKPVLGKLRSRLEGFFDVSDIPYTGTNSLAQLDSVRNDDILGLVLFGLEPGSVSVLRLRDPAAILPMMPQFHSDMYRRLDVSIIDHVVLEKLIGLPADKDKVNVAFSYDAADAVDCVLTGQYQIAFLVNAVTPWAIKAIADLGDKMPKKSTYFYPKVPAGLIVNRMVG